VKAKAPPAESAPDDECPLGDERVTFVVKNPKREGTSSYDRYQKYKKAKTPREAMQLGANKGDLVYDHKKGHLKRV